MIIVISPSWSVDNELHVVNQLFEAGLSTFHLRKPLLSIAAKSDFIDQISQEYRDQIVLHGTVEEAQLLKLRRVHISYSNRTDEYLSTDLFVSVSTHHIEEFNALIPRVEYAFLSPFFASISKPKYGTDCLIEEQLVQRTNRDVQLIALGGIQENNVQDIRRQVDGVALLGAIWKSNNPLKVFEKCKQVDLLY